MIVMRTVRAKPPTDAQTTITTKSLLLFAIVTVGSAKKYYANEDKDNMTIMQQLPVINMSYHFLVHLTNPLQCEVLMPRA